MRHRLVKDGYSDAELGKMKMERVHKLMFIKYVEDYTQWYSYEKNRKDTE